MTPEEQASRLRHTIQAMVNTDYRNQDLDFSKIAGNTAAKNAIVDTIVMPELGIINPLAAWSAVLLFGPVGTGKSFFAKCTAGEVEKRTSENFTFYDVRLSGLLSVWQGEPEKLIAELFVSAAHTVPSIIFVDEIDSLTSKRKETDGSTATCLKSELLVAISKAALVPRVYIIGATNLPHTLDKGFVRRFDLRVYMRLPSLLDRIEIFEVLMADFPENVCWDHIKPKKLAKITGSYSGCDIERLIRTANYLAIKGHTSGGCGSTLRCIDMKHFDEAKIICPPVSVDCELEDLEEFQQLCGTSRITRTSDGGVEPWPCGGENKCFSWSCFLCCGWFDILCKRA